MKHSITRSPLTIDAFKQADSLYKAHKEQIDKYINQLLWWNDRINLVSRDVSRETIKNHITHSLLITFLIHYNQASLVVDAGTGGGLPGIPLAITHPGKEFILNDIVTKKTIAVKQMGQKIGLENFSVDDNSIQDIATKEPFLLISKHAFKINDLIELTAHLPWEKVILYKGIAFEEELEGVEVRLNITAYDLFEDSQIDFYKDKALLVIER